MEEEKTPQLSFDYYPPEERHMLAQLKALFADWEKTLEDSDDQRIRENAREMTKDGFFPNYTRQKKILFLGRDSYGMQQCDYIKTFYDVYRETKWVGDKEKGEGKALNAHMFHARMLYIAWGILNEMPDWDTIPWAEKIGDDFGTDKGISFAFMNLGKLRFAIKGTSADFSAIDAFCAASTQRQNFIADQIAILKPDIIISMYLDHRLKFIGDLEQISHARDVSAYRLNASGHNCLVLDCWHFSSRKSHEKNFYYPIREALREIQRRS